MPSILTPEEIATLEGDVFRNKYPQSERDKMDASVFCGPDQSFPIKDAEDVIHASQRLHNATGDQSAIKKCVIGKAHANGWPLPETWQDDNKDKERMDIPDITRVMGAYVEDADGKALSTQDVLLNPPSDFRMYMPVDVIDKDSRTVISRISPNKREVIATATSETIDGYRTIFAYEASKDAFKRWRGNIREMHDPTKAVGNALRVLTSDEERTVDVALRVSKGAQDTWEKVLDGTLSGLSVGAKNGKWTKKLIGGMEIPVLERYDLVEVSLVDNPANPDCNIHIVRADGLLNQDVVDNDEPEETRTETPVETRAGARVSADTKTKLHATRDSMLQAVRDHMSDGCGCDECKAAAKVLDPDMDGDVDIVPSLDTDGDGGAAGDGSGDGQSRLLRETIARIVQEEISRQANPLILRLNGIASRFAQVPATSQQANPDITRRLEGVEQKLAGLDEVRSLLSEVRDLTKVIAEQPQQAQPIVNPAMLRSMQPDPGLQRAQDPGQSMAELIASGQFNQRTKTQQTDAVVDMLTRGNRR